MPQYSVDSIAIDKDNLGSLFSTMATIGRASGGGFSRLAFTDEDAQARAFVQSRMEAIGLAVRTDEAANLIGRLQGANPGPVVLTGSHLDSVPNGGNYDGVIGVLGALEAIRAIRAAGITPAMSIEVVVFASEEAPRFHQAAHHFGSRVMAGTMDENRLDQLVDDDNVSVAEALRRWGLDPERVADARRQSGEISASVEMHMEQGRILRDRGLAVGIVSTITGVGRYWLRIYGSADHSGATPMPLRRDALAGAAEIILAVEHHARDVADTLVSTVGTIRALPGSISIVPGEVRLGIDIRDVNRPQLHVAESRLREAIDDICTSRGLRHELEIISEDEPTPMSASVRKTIRTACDRLSIRTDDVPSHSGHDTGSIAPIAPVGMIFVRNVSGKSHSPEEFVELDDIALGSRVLAETLLLLADGSSTP